MAFSSKLVSSKNRISNSKLELFLRHDFFLHYIQPKIPKIIVVIGNTYIEITKRTDLLYFGSLVKC